jgi:hypothetical protein
MLIASDKHFGASRQGCSLTFAFLSNGFAPAPVLYRPVNPFAFRAVQFHPLHLDVVQTFAHFRQMHLKDGPELALWAQATQFAHDVALGLVEGAFCVEEASVVFAKHAH